MFEITFPAQARRLPRYKSQHATWHEANAEVRRVRAAYAQSGHNVGLAVPVMFDLDTGRQCGVWL